MSGPGLARVGWRNLWRNPRRTVLTLIAIAFGLFLAILFTALQDRSFSDMIDLAARMGGGHVVVQHPEYLDTPSLARTVADAERITAAARGLPDVEKVVPRIAGPVMLATAGRSYGGYFLAIDPTREDADTFAYTNAVVEGEALTAPTGKGILLGRRLAKNLRVGVGDKVVYTMLDKQGEIASGLARVSGLVDTGAPSLDGALAILPLDTARGVLGYGPTEVTQLALYLDDSRQSRRVRDALAPAVGADARVSTWDEVQADLSGFIAMKVGGARFLEGVILVLVAASIFNTLFVSVLERTRELGIMLAIGWSPRQVFGLVMWESLWLAIVGVTTGLLLTAGPYAYLASHPIDISAQLGNGQPMEVAGVGMQPVLHIGIFPESLAMIVTAVIVATLLSGLYPAWRAGRIVPVDSIKLV